MADARDDADLLDAWRGGDGQAGDELLQRHFAALHRFFASKVDPTQAEDLTGATLLACVDARDRFRSAASFRAYIFGIARNQLAMAFRTRASRGVAVELDTTSLADLDASPITLLGAKAEQLLLLAALRHIPIDFQIALELYYWEGLSTRELADVLEIPEGTVRSRLARAREQVGEHMRRLEASPGLAQSTIEGFEDWARSLRARLD